MKLLIDGYNLVRSLTHRQARENEVQQILGRLRRYHRVTGHDITVVFDGGEGSYRYQLGYHGLVLWYSGSSETADDLIKKFLAHAHQDELVLISNDRELNEIAQERGIVSVSPLFFITKVAEREEAGIKKTVTCSAIKTSKEVDVGLDELMREASSRMPHKIETETGKSSMLKDKKGSKIERRLEALISKL